ncbi:glutamate 5-kinase [Spirochaeta africana]|uniref:Glutamate 5-kinase n=1 Tax=Spirochaeta africana (strain ATCC 700263 / DSM 8902 / Z-7692) TaxID=889378 RepID=H9UKQ5_SPIAZ|nr:glutamate 5-kinase [Spirochaeta africana]AFG38098.1 glutamate 5-kinase [Spirochaeta africana DSM 8902]
MRPSLSGTRRLVIKIGTNVLAGGPGGFRPETAEEIVRCSAALQQRGLEVILVSSGAIGLGAHRLGRSGRITPIADRQVCAAVGQPLLMNEYHRLFQQHGVPIAQVLLTRELLNDRDSFLNIQATVHNLLRQGIIPICNENDSVSTAEIGPVFGDNDNLSAHIASKLDADLLVLLTDIDSLYTADPRNTPDARPISLVERITPELLQAATGSSSELGTGGMRTKLEAVQIAARAGTNVIIADGRAPGTLLQIIDDEPVGTLFLSGTRMKSRQRWIANAAPRGTIHIDAGAEQALLTGKSLLPKGILSVDGSFRAGEIIRLNTAFNAVSRLDSNQIRRIMGRHSSEIPGILGRATGDVVAQAEDIVVLIEQDGQQ